MSDRAICSVINPNLIDREKRSEWTGSSSVMLPNLAEWRKDLNFEAIPVNGKEVVRANFFPIKYPTGISLYVYNVQMFPYQSSAKAFSNVDICSREDTSTLLQCLMLLQKKSPDLFANIQFAYNSRSLLYTTAPLPFTDEHIDTVVFHKSDLTDTHFKIQIKIKFVKSITERSDSDFINALDVSLTNFVKRDVDNIKWLDSNNKIFSTQFEVYDHNRLFQIQRGYQICLRQCHAGLCLVADITGLFQSSLLLLLLLIIIIIIIITAQLFLSGGDLINILINAGNFNNFEEFSKQCKAKNGLTTAMIKKLEDSIKGFKIRQKYLPYTRKVKSLGIKIKNKLS